MINEVRETGSYPSLIDILFSSESAGRSEGGLTAVQREAERQHAQYELLSLSIPISDLSLEMERDMSDIADCDQLSSLRLQEVEGAWQGVESQFDLRLGFIAALGRDLGAVEDSRSQQVSFCHLLKPHPKPHPLYRLGSVSRGTPVCWGAWPTAMGRS